MDYDVGTKLLIQSPGSEWVPAIVEEDDGDEILISYVESNAANEWINKDSYRIKPTNEEQANKLITIPSCLENIVPEIKSILVNTVPAEKEKDIVKKSTSTSRLSNVFKVKFKKDDFLSKKTQDSKHKEQKTVKDKKSSDRESKQLLLHNTSNSEKHSTETQLKNTQVLEKTRMEFKTSKNLENTNSSKDLKYSPETNLSRSENFEELLEDIEAEAEICSPSKSISDIKQKKKRKKYFGRKRRPEKKKRSQLNNNNKKNILMVKLNPQKLNEKEDVSLSTKLSNTDDTATPPSKKMKPSILPSSSADNSLNQNSSLYHQLANNTLLQKIRMQASDEQGLRCPKQECRKLFRKENLLMMHIKHYHAEYTEFLVSTPNVTDLATARIEGENVDELSPSYFLHKISQLEAKRSVGNTSSSSPSLDTISSPMQCNNLEPESITTLQSENLNSSFSSFDQQNSIIQVHDSKDSGFGIVESVTSISSIQETSTQESILLNEPIKKITLVDTFKYETQNNYDAIRTPGSDRHFKIKKNKSEIESLPKEEVINCSCGSNQEDGLMIQCDVCLCWQHGFCNKIDSEDQVPDNYVCSSCLNPSKKRQSKQYDYLQDWIKEGKVASVLQHKDERRKKDENILKQSHQLVAEVIEHSNFLHSLLVKTAIYGQTPDHPKLYLWSEQGSKINEDPPPNKLEELLSGPVPEKPINTAECRKNLLDEIEDGFDNLEARINLFEAKTNGLEDQVSGTIDNEVLSNTVTLLLRDLNSIRHYMSFENKKNESNDV